MTWHDAATVTMKLNVPATQGHRRERAARSLARRFTSSVPLWIAYVRTDVTCRVSVTIVAVKRTVLQILRVSL
jgi:hypothetical protein